MTERTAQAGNITMSGGGNYSLATLGAKHVIDGAWALVDRALEAMTLTGVERPFLLTDMGCADGGTSMAMVRRALDGVRGRASRRPIQVLYADQPRNDYNALVANVYGLGDFDTYLGDVDNVYVAFSGTSFYERIVAPGTLDLGFSATAMHWLSRKPCDITDHVHATGAAGEERAAFEAQGRADQERILTHRAAELASGGRLVLVNFCRDEQGRYLGNTGGVPMFDTFNALWQRFVDDGVIMAEEYQAMTLPQYYNSVDEFGALFESASSPARQAGLELEHLESRVVPCPYARAFETHGDARRFAREYIPTLRSWTQSTFHGALSANRPAAERQAIIDRYYATYETEVVAAPAGHAMDYVHAYMVVAKT